jgi:magnesium transporter
MIKVFHRTIKDKKIKKIKAIRANSWVCATNPTLEEINTIAQKCNLKEDLLRDALDPYEVPRVENDDSGTTYFFTRAPHQSDGQISTCPILIAVGKEHIVTVSRAKFTFLDQFSSKNKDFSTTQRIKFFIQIFTEMNREYNLFLTEISKRVRSVKVRIKKISHKDIIQFVDFESVINDFLSALVPTNSILHNLLSGRHLQLYEKDKDLIEDLFLSNKQLVEISTSTLKTIVNIRDAYSTIVTQDTNRVIKLLTSITIILTIPTIIASLYGMNVGLPFANSSHAFLGIMVGNVIVMYIMALVFIRKNWL